MKLERRKKPPILVPTASIGDIAFLLIIFFMVASNFVQEANLKVKPPKSPDIDVLEMASVSVTMDQDGLIYVKGEECPLAMLQNVTGSLLEGQKERLVMLKIDKDLSEESFRPVIMAISRAGAEVALVGTKSEDY